jgi:L-alanine-DL-glutamate epimerase-like enolase superfamily enzyme
LSHADLLRVDPIRDVADLTALGREVESRGFRALKTNVFRFDGEGPSMFQPGFAWSPGFPELNSDPAVISALTEQLVALREGTGPNMEIHVDLNFNYRTEGYLTVIRSLADLNVGWIELDLFDPAALAHIRQSSPVAIASCESLFTRRQYRPYFEQGAVDVAIIDVPWNGLLESLKIAAFADAYEINVAPHNFYGHLSTIMSAHFCALVPNLRIMEIDVDDVPWRDDIVSAPPVIEAGHLRLPAEPGWGIDINEDALSEHPPRRRVAGRS